MGSTGRAGWLGDMFNDRALNGRPQACVDEADRKDTEAWSRSDTEAVPSEELTDVTVLLWPLPTDCRVETLSGGLWEPRQGLARGPWLWTVPSFKCNCRVARQTLHTPLDLFASSDRSHERPWDIIWDTFGTAPLEHTWYNSTWDVTTTGQRRGARERTTVTNISEAWHSEKKEQTNCTGTIFQRSTMKHEARTR